MVKKIILISVAAILLIFGGLTVYVSNMDWNEHKNEIAARFSATFGKKIDFSGNIKVSLWPKPHLAAKNVNILNPDTSEKLALVPTMEASLSLRALLRGTPEIESLNLKNAEFWYTVDESGISNWHQQSSVNYLDAGIEYKRQTVNLQNCTVHYQNKKYELATDLQQFNADVLAESLAGPYRIDGNFVNRNDHYGFAVSVGDISQTDDIALNFAITHPRSNSYILYDGRYNFANGALKGNFSGEFQKLAELINSLSQQEIVPVNFNLPFVFSVSLEANKSLLSLNSLALRFSQLIEGSGNIKIPLNASDKMSFIEVQYQFLNLDARPFIMGAQLLLEAMRSEQIPYEPNFNYNINFELDVQKMVVSDASEGALENVAIVGSWLNNELNINEFSAACPGNILWTLSGSVVEEDKIPNLFIKTHLEGKNLAALIKAFGYPLTPINQSTFRNADISFNASGNPYMISLSNAKISIDKAKLQGTFVADYTNARPAYTANFKADILNFDNYFNLSSSAETFSEILHDDILSLGKLTQADLDLDVATDIMIIRGTPMKDVTLKVVSNEKNVIIENLNIKDVLGMSINSNADITDFAKDMPYIKNLHYDLITDNISPILLKLNLNLPQWNIFQNKALKSTGTFSGTMNDANIITNTIIGDTNFSFSGKVLNDEKLTFDGNAELKTTNFSELVNNLGDNWQKFKNNSSLNCDGTIKGDTDNILFSNAQCILGTAKYSGSLSLRNEKDNLTYISGNLAVSELDLSNLIDIEKSSVAIENATMQNDNFLKRPTFNRDKYNYNGYKNMVADIQLSATRLLWNKSMLTNFTTHLQNEQNKLTFDNLQFSYHNGNYAGKIAIDYEKDAKITGKLSIDNASLNKFGGKVYKITADGIKSDVDFTSSAISQADFFANLTASATFNIADLYFDGADFTAIVEDLKQRESSKGLFQKIRDNLQQGSSNFQNISGNLSIDKGIWSFSDVSLENADVKLAFNGENNFNDWQMSNDFSVTFLTSVDLPSFKYVYSGPINNPNIDIDVEKLVQYYDALEEKIRAQKQAENEEQQQILAGKMLQAQEKVKSLASKNDNLQQKIKTYMQETTQDKYKEWYKKQLNQLQKISSSINNMQSLAQNTLFSQDDIEQINYNCQSFEKQIMQIESELAEQYRADIMAQLYNLEQTVERYKTENSKTYEEYQKDLQKQFSELMEYGAVTDVYNDKDIQQMQQKIEDLRQAFWEKSYRLNDIFAQYPSLSDIDDLHNTYTNLMVASKELQQNTEQMNNIKLSIAERLDDIKAAKQKAFEEEQAKAKEAETKDTKKTSNEKKTVNLPQNDSADVENSKLPKEQLPAAVINSEAQPALKKIDTTETSGKVSGTIIKSYEDDESVHTIPSTGLLRPIEGEIARPSGTIIVK